MKNFASHSDFRYIAKFLNFASLAKFLNFARIAKFSLWQRNFRNPSEIFAIIAKFPGLPVIHCSAHCTSTASFLHHFAFISSMNFDMLMAGNSFNLHGSTHLDIEFDFNGRGTQKPAK